MAIALFWLFNCILDATERNLAGWQKLFSCVFRLGPNRVSVWWWHQSSQLFLQMKSIFPVNEIYFPSKRNPFSQLVKFIFPVKEIGCPFKRIRNGNGVWPNPFLIIIYAREGVCLLCLVVSCAPFSVPLFSIAPSSSVGGGQQDAVGQRRGCRAGVSRQLPCVRRSTRAWLQPAC